MNVAELRDLLIAAAGAVDCDEVALRCEHSLLETVYVVVRDGALVVTDRGRTFQYLESGDDANYSTVSLSDARSICERHGVEVRSDDPEAYATLEREALEPTLVADAVGRVASAVDELFAFAHDSSPAMSSQETEPFYDEIGHGYADRRRPDPRIAAAIATALGDARTVVNVGAGAGSYEPVDRHVVAVEPSPVMIAQRPPGAAPVVVASAERLPFADQTFDAGMAVLTIHHWSDKQRGCEELRRVVRGPIAVLTCEPAVSNAMWLMRDYAPEIAGRDAGDFPPTDDVARWLGGAEVETIPVPADCTDAFLLSFWSHPDRVLDPAARAATSGLARLDDAVQSRIARAVQDDLDSGAWDARHGHLRSLDSFDAGLRLVVRR